MNDVYAKSQHAGEAAVENARRDESKAPAESKYEFPEEVMKHVNALRDYCDRHRPDVHLLIMLGHYGGHLDDKHDVVEMNFTRSGEYNVLAHMHNETARQLAKDALKEALRSIFQEPPK